MKHSRLKTALAIVVGLFFAPHAQADQIWIGNVSIDTDTVKLDPYVGAGDDTRQITNDSGPLGHLYMSDVRGAITDASSGGSALTYNPKNPTDLWLVTAGHNAVKRHDRSTFFGHYRVTFPQTGEHVEFRPEDRVYVGDLQNEEDIAIFDMPDDLRVKPLPMIPNYDRGDVYILASTWAFDTSFGSTYRLPTRSGACKFWREPDVLNRREDLVATDCVSTLGSSGSPMIGTLEDGTEGIVGVFAAVFKKEIKALYGPEGFITSGNMAQRRVMFKLAQYEMKS